EMAVTAVGRTARRNTMITPTAKSRPSRPSSASATIDSWMNGAWSKTTEASALPPTPAISPSSSASTPSETSTTLPSAVVLTIITSDSRPLVRETLVASCSVCSTVATSARVVASAVGSGSASSGGSRAICSRLSTESMASPMVTSSERSSSTTVPPGTDRPEASIASGMVSVDLPRSGRAAAAGGIRPMCAGRPAPIAQDPLPKPPSALRAGDAVEAFQLGHDRGGQAVGELGGLQVRGDRQHRGGDVPGAAGDDLRLGPFGQIVLDLGESGFDLVGGAGDVGAVGELDGHHR